MKGYLKTTGQAFKVLFANRMAYRADFFISIIVMFLIEFLMPLITILVYRSGGTFNGWSLYEVLLIQGIFLLAKGTACCTFFCIVFNTINRVQMGTFDLLLIKPRPILFSVIVTGLDMEDYGMLLNGICLTIIALVHIPPPTLLQYLQFAILFFLSLMVLFGAALFMAGAGFKWVGNYRLYDIFDTVMLFGRYPLEIFSGALKVILAFVIPVAMVGFFPASILLGKPTEGIYISGAIAILFLLAGLFFYHKMLRNYSSAGG